MAVNSEINPFAAHGRKLDAGFLLALCDGIAGEFGGWFRLVDGEDEFVDGVLQTEES